MSKRYRVHVNAWFDYDITDEQAVRDAATLALHETNDPTEQLRAVPAEMTLDSALTIASIVRIGAALTDNAAVPGTDLVDSRVDVSAAPTAPGSGAAGE